MSIEQHVNTLFHIAGERDTMEYASRAVGNAGLTTGIIGTALGALNGAGGLDLLNIGPRNPRDEV